jgi:hypothetical protein
MIMTRLAEVLAVIFSDTSFPDTTICSPPHQTRSGKSTAKYIEYEYCHSTVPGSLQVVPQSWQSRSGQFRRWYVYTMARLGGGREHLHRL